MTTIEMINLIRANTQPLSHKTIQAIADRLEEQHAHLRSCLCTIDAQEEQLQVLGQELAKSEDIRRTLNINNLELLARCDVLEAEACAS